MGFPSKSAVPVPSLLCRERRNFLRPQSVQAWIVVPQYRCFWMSGLRSHGQLLPTRCQNPRQTAPNQHPSLNGAVVRFPLIVNISDDSDSNRLLVISLTGHAISLFLQYRKAQPILTLNKQTDFITSFGKTTIIVEAYFQATLTVFTTALAQRNSTQTATSSLDLFEVQALRIERAVILAHYQERTFKISPTTLATR